MARIRQISLQTRLHRIIFKFERCLCQVLQLIVFFSRNHLRGKMAYFKDKEEFFKMLHYMILLLLLDR